MKIRFFILVLLSALCHNVSAMKEEDLVSDLQKASQVIGHDQPFVSFNLGLSEKDKQTLHNLKVTENSVYNNYGRLEDVQKEVTHFLHSIGNHQTNAEAGANIIDAIITQSLQGLKAQTAWITIRASEPIKAFDIPRWHRDGYYYTPFKGQQYKIACILQGTGTLFCKVSDQVREQFSKIESETQISEEQFEKLNLNEYLEATMFGRKALAQFLSQHTITQSAQFEGALFIVGDQQTAAIHSEPPIHHNRLFMSILPGTHEQIKELNNRQNKN